MKDQKSRINRFLSDLVDSNLPQEEQIIVFSQEENKDAAGIKRTNSKCTNKASTCGGTDTKNTECTNYDSYCSGAYNMSCTAETSLNNSIMTCGGV